MAILVSGAARTVAAEVAALARVDIDDPSGRALELFAASLRSTAAPGSDHITRVAHYGDSLVVVDELSASLRRLYQERYGSGGPGFVLTAPAWEWYRRAGLRLGRPEGWVIERSISGGPADRWYGYGGVTFEARRAGVEAGFRTSTADGRAVDVSRIDVHYLEQPGGGTFAVEVDGRQAGVVSTAGSKSRSAFAAFEVEPAPHEVVVRTRDAAPVRVFGLALERGGPGVVWDSLGLNGTCMTVLGRMDAEHLAEQMARRRPALVVLTFGAGETKRPELVRRYAEAIGPILGTLRRVAPTASCVVMGPMDRGAAGSGGPSRSNPLVPRVTELQRAAARAAGCAFWDTYAAMGGSGSVSRWRRAGLVKGDLTHPTARGGEVLARGLFDALERAVGSARPPRGAGAPAR